MVVPAVQIPGTRVDVEPTLAKLTDPLFLFRLVPRISVVIPAFNEALNLPHVLGRIPSYVYEVILVDGGSTDNTIAVAREHLPGIRIVEQDGTGKGDAMVQGFDAATGDIIVTLDADGSADPKEITLFVDHLMAGADIAKGSRFLTAGSSDDITRFRSAGNWALTRLVNQLYGVRFTDLCYGYNAFWTRHVRTLDIDCKGFEVETLISVRGAKVGLHFSEVPSHEYVRLYGTSNLRAYRDGSRVLRTILTECSRQLLLCSDRDRITSRKMTWDGIDRRSEQDRRSAAIARMCTTHVVERRVSRRWSDRARALEAEWQRAEDATRTS